MLLVLGPKTTPEDRRVHERAGAADVDAVAELFDQVHDDVERALVPLLVGLAEREELLLRVVVDFVRRQHLRPSLAELHWAWDVPLLRRLLDVAREVAPVDVVEVRLLVVGDQVGGWRVERRRRGRRRPPAPQSLGPKGQPREEPARAVGRGELIS